MIGVSNMWCMVQHLSLQVQKELLVLQNLSPGHVPEEGFGRETSGLLFGVPHALVERQINMGIQTISFGNIDIS